MSRKILSETSLSKTDSFKYAVLVYNESKNIWENVQTFDSFGKADQQFKAKSEDVAGQNGFVKRYKVGVHPNSASGSRPEK